MPSPREGLPKSLEQELSSRLLRKLSESRLIASIKIIAQGHAAGMVAIDQAQRLIQDGEHSMCLVAGVDSYMNPESLRWLDERGLLRTWEDLWSLPRRRGWSLFAGISKGFIKTQVTRKDHSNSHKGRRGAETGR